MVVFRNAFGFEGSLGSHGECSEPWSFHDRTDAHAREAVTSYKVDLESIGYYSHAA